jgi:hypothetical protein
MRSPRCFNADVVQPAAIGRKGSLDASESDVPKRVETIVVSAVLKCRCDGINVVRSVGRLIRQ